MAHRKAGKAPLIRSYQEVDMQQRPLEELALAHRDALVADQKLVFSRIFIHS